MERNSEQTFYLYLGFIGPLGILKWVSTMFKKVKDTIKR